MYERLTKKVLDTSKKGVKRIQIKDRGRKGQMFLEGEKKICDKNHALEGVRRGKWKCPYLKNQSESPRLWRRQRGVNYAEGARVVPSPGNWGENKVLSTLPGKGRTKQFPPRRAMKSNTRERIDSAPLLIENSPERTGGERMEG